MSKIFIRERRHVGKGAGMPRFAVVAVEGSDLEVLAPHLRKVELETMAASIGAEIVYLPRGESSEEGEEEGRQGRGWRKGRKNRQG
jgi:hypothetical protein